jgi:hypothetical protein
MKLQGKITILINREYTEIEIEDENANVRFVRIRLNPEQLSAVLSRQVCVDCELDVVGIDKIGTKHENKTFAFEIPKELRSSRHSVELGIMAQELLNKENKGWFADEYFSSQDTFSEKDGKYFAKCTVRRWIKI